MVTKEDDKEFDFDKFREKYMPYQRYIMIIGILFIIMLVVFLGYAYGSARVCNQLDGFLDDKLKCHLDYNPTPNQRQTPQIVGGVEIDYNFDGG